jgi:hypothetical protein
LTLMEISQVRRQVRETINRAKQAASEHRSRTDEAAREYDLFLSEIAIPMFRQVAAVLRAENYMFSVFTPSGSVRLMSDRSGDDYIELSLDTSGAQPQVIGHSSRSRGRRIIESEAPLKQGLVRDLTEEDVLTFVLKELQPFVER